MRKRRRRRRPDGYYILETMRSFSSKQSKAYLKENVFEEEHFNRHIQQTSSNLKIDEKIVRDVMIHYFTSVFILINTVRKVKTKINIFGFCSLHVSKGDRF